MQSTVDNGRTFVIRYAVLNCLPPVRRHRHRLQELHAHRLNEPSQSVTKVMIRSHSNGHSSNPAEIACRQAILRIAWTRCYFAAAESHRSPTLLRPALPLSPAREIACCLRHQSHSSADARRRSSRQRCLTSCPCPLDWAAQRACHRYRLVPDLRPKRASLRCAPIRNPILQRAVVAAAYRLDRPNSISAAIGPSASMDPKRMMMKQKKGQPELLSNDHECISSPPDCF